MIITRLGTAAIAALMVVYLVYRLGPRPQRRCDDSEYRRHTDRLLRRLQENLDSELLPE